MSQEAGGLGKSAYRLPPANLYNRIPQDPKNPLSDAKVALGKKLYHETGLATNAKYDKGMYSYSCASCHHAAGGFQAGIKQGIGEGGVGFGYHGEGREPNPAYAPDSMDIQPIRTPSALNIAYQTIVLWNGQFGATHLNEGTEAQWTEGTPKAVNHLGYEGTEIQAIAGLSVHRMDVTEEIITDMGYKNLFDQVFGDKPKDERYGKEYAGLAIAAYERTLLANEAPWQRWLYGDHDAMKEEEKQGAVLFFGKAACSSCHTGPALNSMEFYALGMDNLNGPGIYGTSPTSEAHLGRGGFTGRDEDMFKFKVPQLYNLKDSPFYGHGGSFTSVREVIEYKNNGLPSNAEVIGATQLAPQFGPLGLTDEEMTQLTAFVENALHDPNLHRYEPTSLPSGMCFPNADSLSRNDLGCN